MAWFDKMNRAKAYMGSKGERSAPGAGAKAADAESFCSYSDDDDTLPGGDDDDDDAAAAAFEDPYISDDASSIWSYPFGRDADPIQLSPPFRLPNNEDPMKPIYEGWTIHVPPKDVEEVTNGKRVLGIKTVQYFTRNPGSRPSVLFTTHTQKELAEMHMEALDRFHGSSRNSGGCLPLRRLLRRHTSRSSYDDKIDERIRKLPVAVQEEILTLLQDRGRCSSSATRKREFTVALMREQLHSHFASTEPTPARRHRLRWWKDNTRGQDVQYFLVLIGRETQYEPNGLPAYTRLTNPWREVDIHQGILERSRKAAERRKAGFYAPPPARIRRTPFAPPTLRRRAPSDVPRDWARARSLSRDRSRSRSRSIDAPRRWRSRSSSVSSWTDRSRSRSRRRNGDGLRTPPYYDLPTPSSSPPPFPLPPYAPFQPRSVLPPPPVPFMHRRCGGPMYPPRRPVFASGMMGSPPPPPPVWNYLSSAPRPPPHMVQPHPGAFFAPGSLPPSTSWPASPEAYDYVQPVPSYGSCAPPPPPPPPPVNPFSALTTPSSLSSFHVPMFGAIPPPPPPPDSPRPLPSLSLSNPGNAPVSGAESALGKDSALSRRGGGSVMSDHDFMNSRRPYVEDVDEDSEEDATLVVECQADNKVPEPADVAAREDAKVLAKEKPGMAKDD